MGATADAAPRPPSLSPNRATLGFYVQNTNGTTEAYMDCGRNGAMRTVNGDATLFITNRGPGTYRCTITLWAPTEAN